MNNIQLTKPDSQLQQLSLHSFVDDFIQSLDSSKSTKRTYKQALERFELWIAENNITSPQRGDILRYKDGLKADGLASLTVSAYLVAVRRFFAYLEGIKAYPNIAKDIKGMKRPKGFLKDTLTKTQVKRLLRTIQENGITSLRDFAIINLMLRTGIRTIEVVRADIGDLGTESGENVLRIWGKGRDEKDDFVLLTPDAYNPIMDYLKNRKQPEASKPLFVSHSNRSINNRLTTRSIRRIVKRQLRKAGLDSRKLSAHSLRHTAATIALQNGADIVSIKDMLRHTNISTTMVYAHNVNRIEKGAEKFVSF